MSSIYRYLSVLTVLFLLTVAANGQSTKQRNEILRQLNSELPSKGRVKVYEDRSITHILGRSIGPARKIYTNADDSSQFYRVKGYKIQAFSGNNQRSSRDEANSKQSQINTYFPELESVVLFESPFWRLRVGNFETREEAQEVMLELRKQFPSFGKEMYIVADEVKIDIN